MGAFSSPKGIKDILPAEVGLWQFLETTARNVFSLYGFQEIRPPIFEPTELFARSMGEASDIVHKEMYTFTDLGGRSLTLRPEATASVVRAGLQHHLITPDQIAKLYYIGPMFRQERPQAGRFRQFHQMGVEVFGSSEPMVDVESLSLALHLLSAFGLEGLEVQVNQVGCPVCRPGYLAQLKAYLSLHLAQLCEECHYRASHNPLRVFDCKKESCQVVLEQAPKTVSALCEACRTHAEEVAVLAKELGLALHQNDRLVRGLDYYTRTTFEITAKGLGAQNAVCGGGRYDHLVKELGGADVPGFGFALGVERVVMLLSERQSVVKEGEGTPQVFLAIAGDSLRTVAFAWLDRLRKAEISCEMDFLGKSLKAQLRTADRLKAPRVILFGEEELARGEVMLREFATGSQQPVKLSELFAHLQPLAQSPII